VKGEKKFCFCIVLFTGILISVMASMMRLGGRINFKEFMSAGKVYDFSSAVLKKSSAGWLYQPEEREYLLMANKATKRYKLNGKEQAWEFLYLTVDKMSAPSMEGVIRYYGKNKEKRFEHPVQISEGENLILLNPEIPMTHMAVQILNAKGESLSISSMQIRTTPSWYTREHFIKLFVAGFCAVSMLFFLFSMLKRKFFRKAKKCWDWYCLVDILQYGFQLFGDYFGSWIGGKLSNVQKRYARKFLYSLLFAWMVIGNVLNWTGQAESFRYYLAVCAILFLLAAFVSWEKELDKVCWKNPLAQSWLLLWLGTMVSDFFVPKEMGLAGSMLFFIGTFFMFSWQNMEYPYRMFRDIIDSLEIIFFAGIIYCMLFRTKMPAIDYNGLFRNPEDFSMYAVLMLCMFLDEMDNLLKRDLPEKGELYYYIKYITGGAAAFYFVLRCGHLPGLAASVTACAFFFVKQFKNGMLFDRKILKIFGHIGMGISAAALSVSIIHISTKTLPIVLDLEVTYKGEQLLTGVSDEVWEGLLELEPEGLQGVIRKSDMEQFTVWRNYIRRWNLFGHSDGMVRVFRNKVQPYSGYLSISHRYGMFILVPYATCQLFLIFFSGKMAYGDKTRAKDKTYESLTGRGVFLVFLLGISYVIFCVSGNVDMPWGHPFCFCFYAAVGYMGGIIGTEKGQA